MSKAPRPEFARRLELYRAGLTDKAIARELGLKPNTVTCWRRSSDLPVNSAVPFRLSFTPDQAAARMLFYQLGWSDRHIAREQGVHKTTVREWRAYRKLPSNFPLGLNERYRPRPSIKSIAVRVRKAVGRSLAPDIVEDTVADMIVAVLDGSLPLASIEAEARRYGNRVLDRFASKFGPRSLDASLTDDEGFTLLDTIPDASQSSWLEEMGATVW
jgi:hypothetical protein